MFEAMYAGAEAGGAKPPWDHGAPRPQLVEWVEAQNLAGGGRQALVVGCGYGADAEFLASRGFRTMGFDFAPRRLLVRNGGIRPARCATSLRTSWTFLVSGGECSTWSSEASPGSRCRPRSTRSRRGKTPPWWGLGGGWWSLRAPPRGNPRGRGRPGPPRL